NGVFGGLVPLTGIWVCYFTGNIYSGLWYPMAVAAMTFIVGSLLLKETVNVKIWTEVAAKK
ncbi:MAG TPA: MFS transporter, partial [Candidatus Angelobacter sp.]|nr:MFS transporter [Candidatus Angelobacter sp.]